MNAGKRNHIDLIMSFDANAVLTPALYFTNSYTQVRFVHLGEHTTITPQTRAGKARNIPNFQDATFVPCG